jgi:hypothetical protein
MGESVARIGKGRLEAQFRADGDPDNIATNRRTFIYTRINCGR